MQRGLHKASSHTPSWQGLIFLWWDVRIVVVESVTSAVEAAGWKARQDGVVVV